MAQLEMLRGDADLALRFVNTILELSRERGMPLFVALGTACRGWARVKLEEREEGIAELRRGLTISPNKETGRMYHFSGCSLRILNQRRKLATDLGPGR